MKAKKNENFGLIKTLMDAHTMGIHAAASLLEECGYRVLVSPKQIEHAVETINLESSQRRLLEWIHDNRISHIGFSYRLDPDVGVELLGRLVYFLEKKGMYNCFNPQIKSVFFAGLAPACEKIEKSYRGQISTFRGGESADEMLLMMGVPYNEITEHITSGCQYDKDLESFGKRFIKEYDYKRIEASKKIPYVEFGTMNDTLELRLDNRFKTSNQPLIRAHSGPYSEEKGRLACLKQYNEWCQELGDARLLDILSIGSSQLSQSNFGENWDGKPNGGGVPVNSELEYREIWEASRPMLVRTYSGTSRVRALAEMYERSINISWHALSLWWFNELDGRGPNSLYDNLTEHLDTIKYIGSTFKPVETNVPHHFSFRGGDDITYIISGYLAAKTVKRYGVKTFILQNMLNTPRSTWGVQDLAKSRTLIKLVKELEDASFRVVLQVRAGLDFFKPDVETAKAQLASVTALMDDIDPKNEYSPDIIHVVSYSEALFLATPEVINDSIRITKGALDEYRTLKRKGLTPDVITEDIYSRQLQLEEACRSIIKAMEAYIPNLYSPEGLYIAFVAGWLPVPELWSDSEEFVHAKDWNTRMINGGVFVHDQGLILPTDSRINRCVCNLDDAKYILKHKYNCNV